MQIIQPDLVNLYGCKIGDNTKIGAFVEIQRGAIIGKNCKISSHSFICDGVTIGDGCFIGHGVCFINDKVPRATSGGMLQSGSDWCLVPTVVEDGASVGTNATILCGLKLGKNCIIGAGSVVTRNVPDDAVVAGNPACPIHKKETICNNAED